MSVVDYLEVEHEIETILKCRNVVWSVDYSDVNLGAQGAIGEHAKIGGRRKQS